MVFIVCKHYFIVTVHLFHLFDCLLLLFFIIIYLFEIKTFSIQFKKLHSSLFRWHFVRPRDNPCQNNWRSGRCIEKKINKVPSQAQTIQQTLHCSVQSYSSHTWTVSDQTWSGVLFIFYPVTTYSTWSSEEVSHPSTNQARPCLASEIWRDRGCFRVVWP